MAWARHVQNCQHASGPVPKATMRWLAGPEPCREDPDECSARIRCPDLICRCCQFSCAMTMSCFLETFNLDFLFRTFLGAEVPPKLLPRIAGDAAGTQGQLRHRGLTLKRPGMNPPYGGFYLPKAIRARG